jgi:hypothetical protein
MSNLYSKSTSNIVRMSGLPPDVKPEDVEAFFKVCHSPHAFCPFEYSTTRALSCAREL